MHWTSTGTWNLFCNGFVSVAMIYFCSCSVCMKLVIWTEVPSRRTYGVIGEGSQRFPRYFAIFWIMQLLTGFNTEHADPLSLKLMIHRKRRGKDNCIVVHRRLKILLHIKFNAGHWQLTEHVSKLRIHFRGCSDILSRFGIIIWCKNSEYTCNF